jgi:hypothetical protein
MHALHAMVPVLVLPPTVVKFTSFDDEPYSQLCKLKDACLLSKNSSAALIDPVWNIN